MIPPKPNCHSDENPNPQAVPGHQAAQPAGKPLQFDLAGAGRSRTGKGVPVPPGAQVAGRFRPPTEPDPDRDRGWHLRPRSPQPRGGVCRRPGEIPGGGAGWVAGGPPGAERTDGGPRRAVGVPGDRRLRIATKLKNRHFFAICFTLWTLFRGPEITDPLTIEKYAFL